MNKHFEVLDSGNVLLVNHNVVLSHSEARELAAALLTFTEPQKPAKSLETGKELIMVSYWDMLNAPDGIYLSRTNGGPWVKTEVRLCGDEHGDENGFKRDGESYKYFNEISPTSYEWAKSAPQPKTDPDWIEDAAKDIQDTFALNGEPEDPQRVRVIARLRNTIKSIIRKHAPKS